MAGPELKYFNYTNEITLKCRTENLESLSNLKEVNNDFIDTTSYTHTFLFSCGCKKNLGKRQRKDQIEIGSSKEGL